MREPVTTTQFKRDIKLMKRRHKDIDKLWTVMDALIEGESLDPAYRDHPLFGLYVGRRDCHLEPDWLLIYKLEGEDDEVVIFERTGSHADLFR